MSSAEPVTFELWKTVVPSYFLLTLIKPKECRGWKSSNFSISAIVDWVSTRVFPMIWSHRWTSIYLKDFRWNGPISNHAHVVSLHLFTFQHGYMIVAPAQSRKKGNGQSAWAAPRGEKRGMAEVVEPAAKKQKTEDRDNPALSGGRKRQEKIQKLKKNIERHFGALGKELKVDCRSCLTFWISLPEWAVRWISSRVFILLLDKSIVSGITLVTQTIHPVLRYSCTVHLVVLGPCQDDAEKVAEPEEKEKDAPKTTGQKLKEPQTTLQQSRSKRWLTWVEKERKPLRHLTRLVCTHILL